MSAEGDAKFILGNETFKAALENLKSYAVQKAMEAAPSDDEGRKHFLNLARASDHIGGYLRALIVSASEQERVAQLAQLDQIYSARAANRYRTLRGENVDSTIDKVING